MTTCRCYEVSLSNGDCFSLIAPGKEEAAWIAVELTDIRYRNDTRVTNVRLKDEW